MDANFFTGPSGGERNGRACILFGSDQLFTTDTLPDDDTPVTIAVRPEKLRLERRSGKGDLLNRLSGQVLQSVYGGSSITYKVSCGEQLVTVFEQNREAQPLRSGELVTISWSPEYSIVVAT